LDLHEQESVLNIRNTEKYRKVSNKA